ncbi:SMP-30/gluconolactonase/LRE family protein [Mucilaginibacter sp. PAMB04274]|uniref:SMP-30/gluconolactonase/LRE family protein n=1 Tax=Mucilaginibacter sp. PAMB04274 TaxID=3138568 RepID=UPI0031F6173B
MNIISKLGIAAVLPAALFLNITYVNKLPAKVVNSLNMQDSSYSKTDLFDQNAQPKLISRQFEFTEGPAADKEGNVFFTDQPNNAIWKYGLDSKLSLFSNTAGRSNGMYFDKQGNLFTCADEQNEIWKFDQSGKRTAIILSGVNGRKFNGPNDLWMDGKGGIYFTDPYYQRSYWTRTQTELDGEKVYYLPAGKKEAMLASSELQKPNGIAGTADGRYLYVADIKANKTYRFSITKDGLLTDKQLFTDKGSDGMTLDDKGNVYLTGNKGVYIFNADGQQIGLIAIPEPWTANICFGGKNRDMLFITASKAIYTMQMKVRGYSKNASRQL